MLPRLPRHPGVYPEQEMNQNVLCLVVREGWCLVGVGVGVRVLSS